MSSCSDDADADPAASALEGDGGGDTDVVALADVYSGRANPTLALTEAEAEELAAALADLPVRSEAVVGPPDDRLGFRRFITQLSSGGTSQVYWVEPDAVYRVEDVLTIEELLGLGSDGDLRLSTLADEAGLAYAMLYELASQQLDAETVEAIPQPR